jgi:hypothetical protein
MRQISGGRASPWGLKMWADLVDWGWLVVRFFHHKDTKTRRFRLVVGIGDAGEPCLCRRRLAGVIEGFLVTRIMAARLTGTK